MFPASLIFLFLDLLLIDIKHSSCALIMYPVVAFFQLPVGPYQLHDDGDGGKHEDLISLHLQSKDLLWS